MKLLWIAVVVQLCSQISFCDDVSLEESSSKEQSNGFIEQLFDIGEKIYGGLTVWDRNQYGYVARLTIYFPNEGPSLCSGVALSDKVILTLASCVVKIGGVKAQRVSARFQGWGHYTFSTDEIIPSPNYNYFYSSNYAILRKDINRTYMRNIGTVPVLPENRINGVYREFNDTAATVLGWGRTNENDRNNNLHLFPRLYSASVIIQPTNRPTDCDAEYPDLIATLSQDERILCTRNNVAGICQGDWGGPLMVGNVVVGLSMFRTGHCSNTDDLPSAFADVQFGAQWIREQLVR